MCIFLRPVISEIFRAAGSFAFYKVSCPLCSYYSRGLSYNVRGRVASNGMTFSSALRLLSENRHQIIENYNYIRCFVWVCNLIFALKGKRNWECRPIFPIVTECSLVDDYQRFGVRYPLHLQDWSNNLEDHKGHFHRRLNLKSKIRWGICEQDPDDNVWTQEKLKGGWRNLHMGSCMICTHRKVSEWSHGAEWTGRSRCVAWRRWEESAKF
jgi:hypothetical protein